MKKMKVGFLVAFSLFGLSGCTLKEGLTIVGKSAKKHWTHGVALLNTLVSDDSQTTTTTIIKEDTQTQMVPAEMRIEDGYIQYKKDDGTWVNLVALADIQGDPGEEQTPNTIVNAYMTSTTDIVSIKRSVLHLVMSDGTEQTYELGMEPIGCFYEANAGEDEDLGYITASEDGILHGKLSYEIKFEDFCGSYSYLRLKFDLDPKDVIGHVDYSKAGEYPVAYKRFDGKYMPGRITVFYDDDVHIHHEGRLISYYVPKTSSASEIPDMHFYWYTPNDEYRSRKLTAEELEGIDFSTVGEKEITHVFENIYGEKRTLEENCFMVYDPANVITRQVSFDLGMCGGASLRESASGKMATIGYAYNSTRQGGTIFYPGSSIEYESTDGVWEQKQLTYDEFVQADVQALKAVTSDSTVQLHFKDNTACYIEVVCRAESAFTTAQYFNCNYEQHIYYKKVDGQYKVYRAPKEPYLDELTGVICYFDLDVNTLISNPDYYYNFKDGMPQTLDNLRSKDDNWFCSMVSYNYYSISIYDEIVDMVDVDDVVGPHYDIWLKKGEQFPYGELSRVEVDSCLGFRIVEEDYTYVAQDYFSFKEEHFVVSDDNLVVEKTDLDVNRVGFHSLVWNIPKYGDLEWGFHVYDPNFTTYYFNSYIAGDIPFVNYGGDTQIHVPYGTSASQVASRLTGLYLHVYKIGPVEKDYENILVTSDMINTESYDPYDVNDEDNYVYIYYKGAIEAVSIVVDSPSYSTSMREVVVDATTRSMLEEAARSEILATDSLYMDECHNIYANSNFLINARYYKDIDENTHIAMIQESEGACSFLITESDESVTISQLTSEFLGEPVKEGIVYDAIIGREEISVKFFECGVCEVISSREGYAFDTFWQYIDLGNGAYIISYYGQVLLYDCGTYFALYYSFD